MKTIIENKWYYYRLSNKQLLFAFFGADLANHILKTVPDHTKDWFKFSASGRFLMVMAHNPIGYYDKYLKIKEIERIEEELRQLDNPKPQFLIDDDDEYQDQLELRWYRAELREELKSLTNK